MPTRILLLAIDASLDVAGTGSSMLDGSVEKTTTMPMDRTRFDAELQPQGDAGVVDRRMHPNAFKPVHAHEFDTRLLLLEGTMTIAAKGEARSYRAGDAWDRRQHH
jgi:hypothetical protein